MEKSRSYRDLTAWQKSMILAQQIYTCRQTFPPAERWGLVSQMRRAATSIPANIAEGQARNAPGEFRQFIGIALGSAAELETFLILSHNLGFLSKTQLDTLLPNCEEVSRILRGLKGSIL